ncbi:3107_t:CDS:2, partial [Paraglomus occultum]
VIERADFVPTYKFLDESLVAKIEMLFSDEKEILMIGESPIDYHCADLCQFKFSQPLLSDAYTVNGKVYRNGEICDVDVTLYYASIYEFSLKIGWHEFPESVEDLCVKWELSGNRARIGYFDTEGNQIARGANEQAKQVEWGMIKAIQRDSRGDDLGTESNVMSHENVEKRTNKSKIRKVSTGASKDVLNIADMIENDVDADESDAHNKVRKESNIKDDSKGKDRETDSDFNPTRGPTGVRQPFQSYAEVAARNWKLTETGKSSDIYGNKDIKKQSRPISPRYQNSVEVVTTFHIHMPKLKDVHVFVLGSIDELGRWMEAKVCLKRYKESSDYWYSDPVRIPMLRFNDIVHYKYVIIFKKGGIVKELFRYIFRNDNDNVAYEGHSDRDNRELVPVENQYDIWKPNSKHFIPDRDISKSFFFPTQIFETITKANFKAKLMDYQQVFKEYKELCMETVNIEFIRNCACVAKEDAQRVFLCILLGLFVKNSRRIYEVRLGDTFPSAGLLNSLSFIDADDILLKDVIELLSYSVRVLVEHNWYTLKSFEWMGMFKVAAFIDPEYSFLELVGQRKLNADESNRFCECLVKQKLNIETERDIQYIRLFRSFIETAANIRILVFLWKEMIRPDMKANNSLKRNWMTRLDEIINTDNTTGLRVHLDELPDDLDIDFPSLFIKRIINLLDGQRSKWDRDNVKDFVALFKDDRLLWTPEDRMKVLNSVSISQKMEILDEFVDLLQVVLDIDAKMNAKLVECCTQWFKRVINQTKESRSRSNGYNYVYTVYNRLSTIYPILEDRRTIKNELLNIADDQIAPLNEAQIYAAVKNIGDLQVKEIWKSFYAIVQKKLGQSSWNADEHLLEKIRQICGCDGKQIRVPNGFCEDILFHILTKLQESASYQETDEISDKFHQSLLDSRKFWVSVLTATGCVNRIKQQHLYCERVRRAIEDLANKLECQRVTISMLERLLQYSDQDLSEYFGVLDHFDDGKQSFSIKSSTIQEFREVFSGFQETLNQLSTFYEKFCQRDARVTNAEDYLNDIAKRRDSLDKIRYKDILLKEYWEIHQSITDVAERIYPFRDSGTFANVFEECLKEEEESEPLTVEVVAQKVTEAAFNKYNEKRAAYKDWKKLTCAQARPLWANVKNVRQELKLMSEGMKWKSTQGLMKSIEVLAKIPEWKERLRYLIDVLNIFAVIDDEETFSTMLAGLEKETMLLKDLKELISTLEKKIGALNDDCWEIIKEIAVAHDLLIWLDKIGLDDLKNVINGVDDHSDERLIQEDTVSSLMEIKQFLAPLRSDDVQFRVSGFLEKLRELTDKNKVLAERISLCNGHRSALMNMYENITNRGEVTKERIKNAATRGIYIFKRDKDEDRCSVEMSYETEK